MFFLHDSVKTINFKYDKKLNLLKDGIITPTQFINLIDQKDAYMMIGPAVVAKTAIKDFILEWKMKQLNIDAIENRKMTRMSQEELIQKLDKLAVIFPEIKVYIDEFNEQLKTAVCPACTKKRYLGIIVQTIKEHMNDGRDISSMKEFINVLLGKYDEDIKNTDIFSEYDIEWIKPEITLGLGKDLIDNLTNCFDCAVKHIGRAKILHEEFLTGYPDHKPISYDELAKGNKALEQAYLIYLDSISQLDMASCELVGKLVDLPNEWAVEMIELANEIRAARLLYQDDSTKIPDFDELRLKIKKLQIKTKNALNEDRNK